MENLLQKLEEIEQKRENLKPNELVYVEIQTVFNDFFSADIKNFWNHPEENLIHFYCSLGYRDIDYGNIRKISYHSEILY